MDSSTHVQTLATNCFHGQAAVIWTTELTAGVRTYGASPARAFLPRRTYPIAVLALDGTVIRITDDELPDSNWMASELSTLRLRHKDAARTLGPDSISSLIAKGDLVAIDASGSSDTDTISAWATHLVARGVEVVLFNTHVVPFDGRAYIVGGGGTNFAAVVEHVEARPHRPEHVFVLTDGFGPHVTPAHQGDWTWLLLPGGDSWMSERKYPMRVVHVTT